MLSREADYQSAPQTILFGVGSFAHRPKFFGGDTKRGMLSRLADYQSAPQFILFGGGLFVHRTKFFGCDA
jgi:hypothetical protein